MSRTDRGLAAVLAALVSVASASALWIWAAGDRAEAWDGPYYFSGVVPALGAIAAFCGFIAPAMPWRWPALMYASQFIVMVVRTDGPIGPLAPLGFIFMAVLAAVTAVPAYLGAFVRRGWGRSSP